jgi:short-subunit dehydrogenase
MRKTAIVTGGTKGAGRAIATLFAEKGFDVWVCARNEENLTDMKSQWQKRFPGLDLHVFQADLSEKAQVLAFATHVLQTCPRIDVLVNNAGLYLPGNLVDEPDGNLELLLNTNLLSAYHLTRALLPRFVNQKQGYVFNICSIASFLSYPNASAYSISKFALLGFSRVLREEMKPHGIKVTAVMPGVFWSNAWEGASIAKERLMEAGDVAKAIWGCYCLSDNAVVEELILRPQLGDL